MVKETVWLPGGLDVLVYNSGAIWWSSVANTPMKWFQLMQRVNPRDFMQVSRRSCLSLRAMGGTVVLVSCHLRFTRVPSAGRLRKVGMSVLTRELAMDFLRQGSKNMDITSICPSPVRVHRVENFPACGIIQVYCTGFFFVQAIQSAATELNPASNDSLSKDGLRKPTIFSDAIIGILKTPAETVNGLLVLDEDFLRQYRCVSDFSSYSVVPGSSPRSVMPKDLPVLEVTGQDDEGTRMDSTKIRNSKL